MVNGERQIRSSLDSNSITKILITNLAFNWPIYVIVIKPRVQFLFSLVTIKLKNIDLTSSFKKLYKEFHLPQSCMVDNKEPGEPNNSMHFYIFTRKGH